MFSLAHSDSRHVAKELRQFRHDVEVRRHMLNYASGVHASMAHNHVHVLII